MQFAAPFTFLPTGLQNVSNRDLRVSVGLDATPPDWSAVHLSVPGLEKWTSSAEGSVHI